ncbi:alpha/beta hydrolase family protein [Nocardia gipuzkoensis]
MWPRVGGSGSHNLGLSESFHLWGGTLFGRLSIVIVAAVSVVVGGCAVAQAEPQGATVLPPPGGDLAVGQTALHLVDEARADPFQPQQRRELMVSVFYPAGQIVPHPQAHYLSSELVPSLEKQLGIQLPGLLTSSYTDAPALEGARYPVLLYSSGAGDSRLYGTGLAEDLASRGYVVVTIDHPYEASVVEFPGPRLVLHQQAGGFTPELRTKYIDARLADTSFVLDSLTALNNGSNPDAEHRTLPAGLDQVLDLDHVGMVGHSSGGYVAVEAMHEDRRIDAAVDLDGQIGVDDAFGRAVTEGEDRPVLVMTSQQIEQVGDARPSLDAFWHNSSGWKRHLIMKDSAHYDFTDLSALVPAPARQSVNFVGSIGASHAASLVHTYVAAMFDKFLRHLDDTALDQPVTDSEIVIDR